MPEEITLADLQRKQEELQKLALAIPKERDAAKIVALAGRLQKLGEEMEALAQRFEAQELARSGPKQRGMVEVMLTAEQRERIHAKTGVDLPTVLMRDDSGVLAKTMPGMDPRIVELRALEEAERRKRTAEVEAESRRQLDAALRDIEQKGMPQVREKLEELKRDPKFLNGMLQPKKP